MGGLTLPQPYYDDGQVTIYHGDATELLPTMPSVDLILTDPPYGLGDKWQGGGGEHTKTSWRFDPSEAREWDGSVIDSVLHLPSMAPYVVIWGGNYYALPPSRCWFLWDKKQNDQWTTAQAEMAWTNVDRPIRTFRMSQVEAHTEMGHKKHPTQKPVSLMKWCIRMVNADVTTILDPFMGSGTTLRAAKDLGIRAIGIEKSERYCEIAVRRLAQSVLPLEIA